MAPGCVQPATQYSQLLLHKTLLSHYLSRQVAKLQWVNLLLILYP